MDTSKLKRFAPECREQLMEQVGVKLDYVLTTRTPDLAEQENLVRALQPPFSPLRPPQQRPQAPTPKANS